MKVLVIALVALLVVAAADVSLFGPESTVQRSGFETGDFSQWRERQCLSERLSDAGHPFR